MNKATVVKSYIFAALVTLFTVVDVVTGAEHSEHPQLLSQPITPITRQHRPNDTVEKECVMEGSKAYAAILGRLLREERSNREQR